MTPTERLIAEAAIDVAVERMTTLHPGHQIFVFGPEGDPMWSHYEPDETELDVFRLALTHLEQQKGRPAPLSITGATGLYTAFVLDDAHTLFSVVLSRPRPRRPAEAKVSAARRTETARSPAQRRSSSARR
ncbi:MAG: hypothetical protein ACO1OB_13040 [Archangium sp.]